MGSGQQMSSFGMAEPVVSTSGKPDFWVLNRRKLVIALAIFLPSVISCSNKYFAILGAPTEFFKGRPLAAFIPLSGSANTTVIFDTNTNRNDTEVESNFENTGNATESLLTQPAEESVDSEMESSFQNTGKTTDSLRIQPAEENIVTELEPNFEDTGNTTESLSKQPADETIDTEVESSFHNAGNSTESFDTQPAEENTDNELEPNFEGPRNTTDSLSSQPDEERINPDADAEDEEAPHLDPISETLTSANESSSGLGFPNRGLANVTTSDSLKNFTSPNVNATSEISEQKSPEDNSGSEQSIITMEGQGLSNETSKGSCNLLKGSWVPDPRQPAYTNATCDFILEAQNCIQNGRPDSGYLHWRWQPEQCDLPQIRPQTFLTAMRNRSMAFVGDSIARNQFQSLLCLLAQSERPENTYKSPEDRDNVFLFRQHNFTMAVYWSPYLVHVDYKQITLPSNATQTGVDVHLDKLDEALLKRMPGLDILHISTGQWWFKFAYFMQNGENIGCHTYPGMPECRELGFVNPYRSAIRNVLRGVLSVPGFTGTTVWRSFAPDHFENGSWSSGGQCVRTEPGGVPMSGMSNSMYQVQMQVLQNVTGALSASEKQRLRLLDVTNLAQERPDGHPNAYRIPHPFSRKWVGQEMQKDCLHWCLPGPIDTWNELFVETLRDVGYN